MEKAFRPGRSGLDILRDLTQAEFRDGLREAQRRRDAAAAVCDDYQCWFDRLEPYLARDPEVTIDEALESYRADCRHRQTGEPARPTSASR